MRSALEQIREDEPGARFLHAYERHKIDNQPLRYAVLTIGVLLMMASAVTFWLPGPNFVLVLAGLAIVGGQSKTVAGWMDRGEVYGRRLHDEVWVPFEHKRAVKIAGGLVVLAGAAGIFWLAKDQGWLPTWLEDRVT